MQINWKVRFKQKVFLTSFISLIISFVYSMLALFDVFPAITKNQVLEFVNQGLALLGLLGVIVDPTTAGVSDSERAMSYDEPYKDPTEASWKCPLQCDVCRIDDYMKKHNFRRWQPRPRHAGGLFLYHYSNRSCFVNISLQVYLQYVHSLLQFNHQAGATPRKGKGKANEG